MLEGEEIAYHNHNHTERRTNVTKVSCPNCGGDIDSLYLMRHEGFTELRYRDYHYTETRTYPKEYKYHCPICDEVLATTEGGANRVLGLGRQNK